MNNRIFAIFLLSSLPLMANAQLRDIANKLKNKVQHKTEQRIDRKADKAIDETLDEIEGKNKVNNKENNNNKDNTSNPPAATEDKAPAEKEEKVKNIKAFSKFDFIPGENILYAEDFAQEAIGELPLHWNTSGKGEIVTLEDFSGRWLKMYQNTSYLTSNKKEFPKNFTLEFDMILQFNYKSYTFPLLTLGFLASSKLESTDNALLQTPATFQSAQLQLRPYANGNSSVSFMSFVETKDYFKSADQQFASLEKYYNQSTHIAMQIQESRLRIWINSEKVFDIPKALATQYNFNQLFFKIHNSGYKEDQIGFYISNIKIATGLPDTRHKLIEEGKFSTNGILFDFQSAVIKPESYGIVKEVAGVLKDHQDVKIKIVGHTSSDGDDKANMDLSKRRSAAVKDLLVAEFGIESSRINTEGKGETEPIADNQTKEGKLLNRRVAFIKL